MIAVQVLDSLIDGALLLSNEREGDELIGMMVRYLRTGADPSPRTDAQRMALAMVRPVLDKSRARIAAGSEGGSKQSGKSSSKAGSKEGSKEGSETGRGEPEGDGIPYAEIVSALNDAAGTAYRPTSRKTRQLIRARWAEGFRAADFKAVIATMAAEWLNDPKMGAYLRPETLFGTKFEGYLNRKGREARDGDPFAAY